MSRKAQLYSQIFIYILTLVLVSFILVYGYNAIQNFQNRAEQVSCLKFKNELKSAISLMLADFGSVKKEELQLCDGYKQVCFAETFKRIEFVPSSTEPIIRDSILSNTGRNVFLVEKTAKDSFYAGNISVEPDNILCINAINSRIILRLEGKGNHVLLSEWK